MKADSRPQNGCIAALPFNSPAEGNRCEEETNQFVKEERKDVIVLGGVNNIRIAVMGNWTCRVI